MAGVVGLAAFNVVPISISAVIGCFVLIATGCLRWRDATHALSAQVIFIIVASLALGAALMATGGADYLANLFVVSTAGFAPGVVLGILMFSMAIMTNVDLQQCSGCDWDTHCGEHRTTFGNAG